LKIVLHDQDLLLSVPTQFEVYRPLCFGNIRLYISDFVAPLLGNRRCHGNHFIPHLLGSSSCYPPITKLIRPSHT